MEMTTNDDMRNGVIIKNIPPTITSIELRRLCKRVGDVLDCVLHDSWALVTFETEPIAYRAIYLLNNYKFGNNLLVLQNAGTNESFHIDCEIIAPTNGAQKCAKLLEKCLSSFRIKTETVSLNNEITIKTVLWSLTRRGCFYALQIPNQIDETKFIVHFLCDDKPKQEDLSFKKAILLIVDDFEQRFFHFPQNANEKLIATDNFLALRKVNEVVCVDSEESEEETDENVPVLLSMLSCNLPITPMQYDRVIDHLENQRNAHKRTLRQLIVNVILESKDILAKEEEEETNRKKLLYEETERERSKNNVVYISQYEDIIKSNVNIEESILENGDQVSSEKTLNIEDNKDINYNENFLLDSESETSFDESLIKKPPPIERPKREKPIKKYENFPITSKKVSNRMREIMKTRIWR